MKIGDRVVWSNRPPEKSRTYDPNRNSLRLVWVKFEDGFEAVVFTNRLISISDIPAIDFLNSSIVRAIHDS